MRARAGCAPFRVCWGWEGTSLRPNTLSKHLLFGTQYRQKQGRGVGNLRSTPDVVEKKERNGSFREWISIIRSLMPLFASLVSHRSVQAFKGTSTFLTWILPA